MVGLQEYQWSRPGCFVCKEPIGNRDYFKVTWMGKTHEWSVNLCAECWGKSQNGIDLDPTRTGTSTDPTHGRNVAI